MPAAVVPADDAARLFLWCSLNSCCHIRLTALHVLAVATRRNQHGRGSGAAPLVHHAPLGRHLHARLGGDVLGEQLVGGCVAAEERQAAMRNGPCPI